MRGAAAQTARRFGIFGASGASRILRIATQIAEEKLEQKLHQGRPSAFDETAEEAIVEAFGEDETSTYREVANKLGLPHAYDAPFLCDAQTQKICSAPRGAGSGEVTTS